MPRRLAVGFSLLELMFILCIFAMLLGIGIPYSAQFIEQHQLTRASSQIQSQLYAAKLFAYQYHQTVMICPQDVKQICGSDWSQPWQIWRVTKPMPHLLQTAEVLPPKVKTVWMGLQSGPILVAPTPQHAILSGHFILSTQSGLQQKLILSRNGDVRVNES